MPQAFRSISNRKLMKKYKDHTLQEYLNVLSKKTPVPGGGSTAALTAACGAALISMVANYSKGKGKSKQVEKRIENILKQSELARERLTTLIDLDAKAYLGVVKARGASKQAQKKALNAAAKVPKEVSQLCFQLTQLTPYLVEHGNHHLLSDIIVAIDLIFAAFNSARANVEANS
jgi:formiminotetrahydrofolate cyclodeaminase